MKGEIKYISHYDVYENKSEGRRYALSAANKVDYICKSLNKIGYKVLIVSPSRTINNKFYKGKTMKIKDDVSLKLFPTFPWGNKFQKAFSIFAADIMLFFYLLLNIKRNEEIIVYHSLWYKNIIRYAKFIKRFKLILEVEEIYQDVMYYPKHKRKLEYKTFKSADKFIFSTELLNEKLNSSNKKNLVVYGAYQIEEDRNCKFNDGKIHVVYAGTFEISKGGAIAAIKCAEYLPSIYHVHIIGFGTEKEKIQIQELINKIDSIAKCTVTYDGLLQGEKYIRFLQSCDIGLSTQTPNANYNNTSFPSKILSYLANGLRVVSANIKVIEKSEIKDLIHFYNKQSSREIAETIMSIDLKKPYNSTKLIESLDKGFRKKLKAILEK